VLDILAMWLITGTNVKTCIPFLDCPTAVSCKPSGWHDVGDCVALELRNSLAASGCECDH
jgi:hypothetical protein